MEAQDPHALGDGVVIGDHGAAVAEATEVLGGKEGEGGRVAERACAPAGKR
jgi:hypothetical protein